ncbi:MAG: nucleotidyl transferase AbiEii/AbiGii toxin family protein [Candidatus Acidiferrum sp.]
MNLAAQLELLRERGFDEDRAQIILLIWEAAILLFQAFPDTFLLYGGANLILFHESSRTSRDLDLLSQGNKLPSTNELAGVLTGGLQEMGRLLEIAPLTVKVSIGEPVLIRLEVGSKDGRSLFTVDLGGLGSVFKSGIEEHEMEAIADNRSAIVRAVSRDHLLLQKAEAFVFRRGVKARDAYDIKLLLGAGAKLSGELRNHLSDTLAMREIGREELADRIGQVTERVCRGQLSDVLPGELYRELERAEFEPLRAALRRLFEGWL